MFFSWQRGALIASIVLFLTYLFQIIRRTFQARRWLSQRRRQGLPMPTHNTLFGHLRLVGEAIDSLPRGCAVDVAISNIAEPFQNGVFYLDFAPVDKVNIVVTSMHVATQVQKLTDLEKPSYVRQAVDTICGGPNLFSMSGHAGKMWRNTFNRGFSVAYIQSIAPVIAREVEVFRRIMDRHADSGKIVKLLDPVTNLTIDVIASIGLDSRLRYQEKDSVLADTMMSQLRWAGFSASMDLKKQLNPLRPLILWHNKRRIHQFIGDQIDKRYIELGVQKGKGLLHSKSAMSLALRDHANTMNALGKPLHKVESVYKATLTSQIMLFLMGGQDTTSSTITYCLHHIYSDASVLELMRAEHSKIFGEDTSASHIIKVIDENPSRMDDLPYTTAVIKETLRLYPPASTLRKGEPGVTLVDDEGNVFPTEGCNIWVVHAAIHRDPRYFTQPHSFIPERWLVEPGNPLYPVKGAYRPFETGQRSCLGQTLATMTIKLALLMVVRSLMIDQAFDEDDEPGQKGSINEQKECSTEFAKRNFGKAYPVYGIGLAVLPNRGYPCKIRSVKENLNVGSAL